MTWDYTTVEHPEGMGLFYVLVQRQGYDWVDVTFFRNKPIIVEQFTYGDPFGDSTAVIRFPQITAFDGPADDTWWLTERTNVNIYYFPATTDSWTPYHGLPEQLIYNPKTGQKNLYLHVADKVLNPEALSTGSSTYYRNPDWEGFITSLDPGEDGVTVQCQGALFQLDSYLAKPQTPYRPVPFETLIQDNFNPRKRSLYTKRLQIHYPTKNNVDPLTLPLGDNLSYGGTGWKKAYTSDEVDPVTLYTPWGAELDKFWTGYATRNTGSFEPALTGYIASLLQMMYVDADFLRDGATAAERDQWTVARRPERRRTPILMVRERNRPADFYVWYGTPGVSMRLTRDASTITNVVFGKGQSITSNEADWATFEINTDDDANQTAEWYPLHNETGYWPYDPSADKAEHKWAVERYAEFPLGVDQSQGTTIAKSWVNRDSDPGWVGDISLQVDPITPAGAAFLKWKIRPGHSILVKGFYGSGDTGIKLHVAEVTISPQDGVIALKVDSKYRDLLSADEAIARARDPLTPVKALKVNSRSNLIEDIVLPWDYSKGAGYIPRSSYTRRRNKDTGSVFPYEDWTRANPPSSCFISAYGPGGNGDRIINEARLRAACKTGKSALYVPIKTRPYSKYQKHWAFVKLLTASAGSISVSELAAYDWNGNQVPAEFHVSFYLYRPDDMTMPRDPDEKMQPFFPDSFQTHNDSGQAYPQPNNRMPDKALNLIQGWGHGGTKVNGRWIAEDPCGYWPSSKTERPSGMTGMFKDMSPWPFDNMSTDNINKIPGTADQDPIYTSPQAATLWAAIYCQNDDYDWLYFMGRLYKQVQT